VGALRRHQLVKSILARLREPASLLPSAERIESLRAMLVDVAELAELAAEPCPIARAAEGLLDVLQPYQAQLGPEVHGAIAALEEAFSAEYGGKEGEDGGAV